MDNFQPLTSGPPAGAPLNNGCEEKFPSDGTESNSRYFPLVGGIPIKHVLFYPKYRAVPIRGWGWAGIRQEKKA